MHRIPASLALVASLAVAGCAAAPPGQTPMTPTFDPTTHVQAATQVLRRYEAGLNAADVDAIAALYAPDAVFMAQHRSPAIGLEAITAAYTEIFGILRLHVTFEVDEVVVVSPTLAYARTRSTGTTTFQADGMEVSEGNQELFLLVRDHERADWRIGRYIFSTTQPPRSGS